MKMRKDLNYIIDHVFFPLRLPQKDDSNVRKDASLAEGVLVASRMDPLHQNGRQHASDT